MRNHIREGCIWGKKSIHRYKITLKKELTEINETKGLIAVPTASLCSSIENKVCFAGDYYQGNALCWRVSWIDDTLPKYTALEFSLKYTICIYICIFMAAKLPYLIATIFYFCP